MKCQVAATAVALAALAREGFQPNGDLMLVLMADEEVGESGVGSPFFVEARPDLCPDYVVGEGAGERFVTPAGPVYLLDCGVKATASATLTVHGRAGRAPVALRCAVRRDGDVATVAPEGELDLGTAPILDAQLSQLREAGIGALVLDLRSLTFIDSAGVRLLIGWARSATRSRLTFRVIPGSDRIELVFALTRAASRREWRRAA
jgi:anti-anti-sigma factor